MGENIYTLPSDMNLEIRSGTVGYNNKILISDEKFILGKGDKVNAGSANAPPTIGAQRPAMKSHKYSETNYLQEFRTETKYLS